MGLHYVAASGTQQGVSQSKTLLILLHGGALSSSMYKTLTPLIEAPSISVDLPGHGKSHHHGPFSFARSTELLFALVQKLREDELYDGHKIVLVGISLGGQAVLHFIRQHPEVSSAAVVSGASIHPPDDEVGWEMPHMPTDQEWLDIMTKDIGIIGMEAAHAVQAESFAFTFDRLPEEQSALGPFPPLLICIGEHDVAMARRDWPELLSIARSMNRTSSGKIIEGAWHNHSIDIPETFAKVLNDWAKGVGACQRLDRLVLVEVESNEQSSSESPVLRART